MWNDERTGDGQTFLTGINIRYSLSVMRTDHVSRNPQRESRCGRAASCTLVATAALLLLAPTAFSQEPTLEARVPTSNANVHDAPSTASGLLVVVPEGTVLPVVGRQGEWVQVRLSPELRQTGTVVRWYEGRHEIIRRGVLITIGDEDSGWMHDSTVEISE
jgi:hypothetical protein